MSIIVNDRSVLFSYRETDISKATHITILTHTNKHTYTHGHAHIHTHSLVYKLITYNDSLSFFVGSTAGLRFVSKSSKEIQSRESGL